MPVPVPVPVPRLLSLPAAVESREPSGEVVPDRSPIEPLPQESEAPVTLGSRSERRMKHSPVAFEAGDL